MPVITTILGDVNLRTASAKVSIFLSPKGKGVEKYISQAAKEPSGVTQRGSSSFSSSVQGTVQEIGGKCITSAFHIADGIILKVFVKIQPGYGKMDKVACFFIRPREGAAYRLLKINTIDHESVLFKSAKIEGCFDMLTLAEATAEGVLVNEKFRRIYDPMLASAVISSNTILHAEKRSVVRREVVEVKDSETGESMNVVRVKRRRAITL